MILQERLNELRKTYMNLKYEVAILDRKKKKAKKRDRDKNTSNTNSPKQYNDKDGKEESGVIAGNSVTEVKESQQCNVQLSSSSIITASSCMS